MQIEVFSYTMASWAFFDYCSRRGENEILVWLNSLPIKAKAKINARIIALQGFPIFPEQYFSAYKTWDDLYELRIVFANVAYRPFGFYGPGRKDFSLLVGGIEKGKIPVRLLEVADERRKIVIADPTRVRRHDFS